ncbi:protein FAM169B-like isoform X4 [Phyllostomus hastatus]|uniref:protein FAM169B-like isoform X4 n=1 Tax=Phyllostomus hastatus TaxID=9423 RepID=UPI001E6810D7|nr:protein FAM169B-like isoform X4 [Phyllostomus hastatus]
MEAGAARGASVTSARCRVKALSFVPETRPGIACSVRGCWRGGSWRCAWPEGPVSLPAALTVTCLCLLLCSLTTASSGGYPVDILEDDPDGCREAALAYYTALSAGMRPAAEVFSLPTGEQVQSFAERIVLFILNVVVLGRLERRLDDDDNMFFLPFSWKEEAKVLWRDGAAVGFYTTKAKGSLCGDGTGACYLLPVFDTVFVRRGHRRRGLGMAMLWDFCETFREDGALGVSWPISPAMLQVCRKFLSAHPEERGRLWEVEPPGAWGQRDSIWLKVQLRQSRLPDRRAALPGNPAEDGSSPGQTSQDDGPRQSRSGEGSQERIGGEEPEEAKEDQDCAVGEAAAELPGRRCRAELDGKRA